MNRTRFRYFSRRSDVSLAIENRIVTRSFGSMLRFPITFWFHFTGCCASIFEQNISRSFDLLFFSFNFVQFGKTKNRNWPFRKWHNGTYFELRPETGGPLPGIVLVRGTGTAAGMALCVQPQCTTFVFLYCNSRKFRAVIFEGCLIERKFDYTRSHEEGREREKKNHPLRVDTLLHGEKHLHL